LILDHHLVYLKSTAEEENKLYGFLQEEEQDLSMRIDPLTRLSARDNYLIWDQKISFLSRPLDIKSQIVLWNKLTDQREIITEPGNYICPEIDPQGQRIALLDYTFQGKYALVIMDLRGEELKRFPLDDFVAAHWPSWSKNGEEILLVVQLNQGNQLIKINLNDGTMEPLTSAIPMTIKKPFWYDENPAFILNTSEGQELIQLTPQGPLRLQRGGLGVNGAATDEQGDLYLVGFNSSQGEQLGYWEDPIWENISWDQEIQRYISLFPAHRELENVDENSINLTREVVPYKGDYFQPYGWGFYSLSGELPWGPVIPFSLMSKDPLGTNQWEMSLLYNQDLKQTSLRFWGQYFMGIIPLELQLEQEIPWKQWGDEVSQGTMGIELPLGFDRASFYLHAPLDLGLQAIYSNSDTSSEDLSIQFQSDLNFQMGQTGSVRDIGDSWENNIYLFCSLPLNNTSQQLYGVSTMTGFTGPWKHHIQLEYGYQLNQSDLSSLLKFPRGWEAQDFKSQQTWSINYQIPLAYPEAELTRLLFVSRLRVQFFYDGLYNQEDLYNSVGTEFIMDFYPLQIPLEFSGGIRLSFLLEEQIPKVDIFLLNVAY
jgi:hypothetical protein